MSKSGVLSNVFLYMRSGNLIKLYRVKSFSIEDGALKVEQDTQAENLVGSVSFNDIEAVTTHPCVPDCDAN